MFSHDASVSTIDNQTICIPQTPRISMSRSERQHDRPVLIGIFLLAASICSMLLVLSCVPAMSGQRSLLHDITPVKLLIPANGIDATSPAFEVRIGMFGIYSNPSGNMLCTTTTGRSYEDILSWIFEQFLSGLGRTGIAVALGLQKKVFLPTPLVALAAIAVAVSCTGLSRCFSFRTSARFRLVASINAFFAATAMLLDGFASRITIGALQVLSHTGDFKFEDGKAYTGLQWAVFGCCLLAALDMLSSYGRGKQIVMIETRSQKRWWRMESLRPALPRFAPLG
ncbi:hypothetical protein BDV96DRAFT_29506 [Lophiotrema nucula]|uniref:Uncharacterized protein n=1 Tax=Lophiotrema nucula TaxID=690887 RepID=A0A6A5ZCD3_9PLEO|nr:hypothetical protein BDV96DRAFT_29506 [Lophiotrema nucula]